jgi:ribosomal protein L11 methyltransferase
VTEPDGTARVDLPVDADRIETTAARLFAAGAVGVWERDGALTGWFGQRPGSLGDDLDEVATWSHEPDRDWQDLWKRTIRPVRAGRFVVVPTWLADDHEPRPGERTIVLDPGRAFGSGHHATTALCLELLDLLDDLGMLAGRALADVGCGSGVLAIAAARCGARVTAVDLDPVAVEVARANAVANDVALDVRRGSVEILDAPYAVVVANLVTDVVATLAPGLVDACAGELVVSGISAERQEVALAPLREAGARVLEVRERDGWIAARLRVGRPEVAGEAVDPQGSSP